MLYRGILTKLEKSASGELSAEVELIKGQKITGVEFIQDYGIATMPPIGSRVVIGFVLNGAGNATILKVEHPDYRPSLAPGEVGLYDSSGKLIKLDDGGNIEVNTKINSSKEIVAPEATIGGIAFTPHVHDGVQSGSSNTGGPQ